MTKTTDYPLPELIGRVSRSWRRQIDVALQPHGVTEATWLPLVWIGRAAIPLSQVGLASAMGLERSAVSRLLDKLEDAKLVERRVLRTDRRSWRLALTEEGKELVDRVEQVAAEVRKRALANISQADLAVTAKVLADIGDTLEGWT